MKVTTLALFTMMILNSAVFAAAEISLPTIAAPAALREGTQRELTVAQISELLPWAKNSKALLVDALDSVDGLSTQDKIDRLTALIGDAVLQSAPKNSELFLRYTLNRALVVNETLDKEINNLNVGSSDVKLRVLVQSIKLALKYYDVDLDNLQNKKKGNTSFVQYGMDYYAFLTELNKSIFDASAQYNIQRMSLEFLQWDLYRDLNNASYASQILKINTNLKFYPATKVSDAQALNYIRQMKKLALSLNLSVSSEEKKFREDGVRITTIKNETEYAVQAICKDRSRDGLILRVGDQYETIAFSYADNSFFEYSNKSPTSEFFYIKIRVLASDIPGQVGCIGVIMKAKVK